MQEEYAGNPGAVPDDDPYDLAQWSEAYKNATIEDREFESVPDGKYQVVVDTVEMAKSQTSGNPMLKWKLKVIAPSHVGGIIWRNNVIGSDSNVRWLKNDLHVCGLDLDEIKELPAKLGTLLNVALEVTKKTRGENENVYINRRITTDQPASGNIDEQLRQEAAKVF